MAKDHAKRVHTAGAAAEMLTEWVDAQSHQQIADAVAKAANYRRLPRRVVRKAAINPRMDETTIYGEEEEAEIRAAVDSDEADDHDRLTVVYDDESGASQIIEVEPDEPADRLDQAVTFSIWAAALVILALIAGILFDALN